MISLCPKYELHGCECAYSCVLSQISELKCVHIGAPMSICAYVYSLGTRLAFYVVGANGSDGFREKSLWRAWLPLTPHHPPPQIHPISSPHPSCQHCTPVDNQAWISSDITLKRWLSPSMRKGEYFGLCVSDGCECYVCVQVWLDGEGGGERDGRIREPSESWLGADTTPPHQGLNLLKDQSHLWWAGIIISSIGQFLYYSHLSTCEIWTLVIHLQIRVSCFWHNLVLYCARNCAFEAGTVTALI